LGEERYEHNIDKQTRRQPSFGAPPRDGLREAISAMCNYRYCSPEYSNHPTMTFLSAFYFHLYAEVNIVDQTLPIYYTSTIQISYFCFPSYYHQL